MSTTTTQGRSFDAAAHDLVDDADSVIEAGVAHGRLLDPEDQPVAGVERVHHRTHTASVLRPPARRIDAPEHLAVGPDDALSIVAAEHQQRDLRAEGGGVPDERGRPVEDVWSREASGDLVVERRAQPLVIGSQSEERLARVAHDRVAPDVQAEGIVNRGRPELGTNAGIGLRVGRDGRRQVTAAAPVIAHQAVTEGAEPVQLGDVGEVLHRMPQVERSVPAGAEGLALGPLHHRVGVHQRGQHERRDHDDEELPGRLLATAPSPQRGPRGLGSVGLGLRGIEHQNWK